MALPWRTIDHFITGSEGVIELRQRGQNDFLISLGQQILMNSKAQRSELALGRLGCQTLREKTAPRVLVGGLGMGYTLRAVLDNLPKKAEVWVAELHPTIVEWCFGPLAELTGGAAKDPRVTIKIGDVAKLIADTAREDGKDRFDAIILDLYRGPHAKTEPVCDPLYGSMAISNYHNALRQGGTLAVWGENHDERFLQRLKKGGFKTRYQRPGKGGYRHAVFLAFKTGRHDTGKVQSGF